MLQVVDFKQQVQNVINAHSGNVDVIKADNQTLARPGTGTSSTTTPTTAQACTTRSTRR
ncbi:hypothetical protein I553_5382 [Mycobacterium xenopi 4042]|uniref:Uncharacterized protein n=1 Tax=Mycobacterium xenopi 4042 TaxID=1299334 RepID=X7ZX32_MYCXE|nr:hypothetical protein I553_5382 [Mycobacterium xenopi 4042]